MSEIKILMLVNVLCVSAMMAFLSVVGPIVRTLGMAEWQAGITVSVGGVMWVFLARYWGKKSDYVGRKKILLLGISGFALSYFVLALFVDGALLSPPAVIVSFAALFAIRGIIGLFYSAIPPVSAALVADKTSPDKRASYMAALGAASGLGMIIGPIAGGALAVFGLSIPMYAAAVLPALAVLAVFFGVSHTSCTKQKYETVLGFFDKRLRLAMTAAFLTMYSVVTSQACLGFYVLDTFELSASKSAEVTGYVLAAVGVSFIAAQIVVSKVSAVSPVKWLRYGALTATIGFIMVSFMNSQSVLTIGFCIAAAGMGLIYPAFSALAANSVSMGEQGAAAGSVSSAQGVGIIAGPVFSTALYGMSPVFPFLVAATVFAVLALMTARVNKI